MTETTSDAYAKARAAGDGAAKTLLKSERVGTKAGVHPYDDVTWERRDVVQTDWGSGETIFEQHGVEFPEFWSLNASTIVSTKYFRGAVGSTERENSLKQLIDRVRSEERRVGKG